jgi:hypothetical protein
MLDNFKEKKVFQHITNLFLVLEEELILNKLNSKLDIISLLEIR